MTSNDLIPSLNKDDGRHMQGNRKLLSHLTHPGRLDLNPDYHIDEV